MLLYFVKQFGAIKMRLNKAYGKLNITKHKFRVFPTKNGLKQGGALSSLLFNFALAHTAKKVQENQEKMALNGTYQKMVYIMMFIHWVKI
jgi:hypothetical protein